MGRTSAGSLIESSTVHVELDNSIVGQLVNLWLQIRAPIVAPLLQLSVYLCLAMVTMMFVERMYMFFVIILVRLFRRKPEKRFKWRPIVEDMELGSSNHPKVLVQVPMFNEREVYQLSIRAVCGLQWPADKLVIQVLDDSTDTILRDNVFLECQRWANKGIDIKYVNRNNRSGYKAGALREGLKLPYVKECEYVTIFDADFQPDPGFLQRTVPFLKFNPEIALVQARWKFVNADECLMTRLQEMSLDYHFSVEQEVGSSTHSFFGFNGTAGVWRISAIEEAGGWKDRTTVEDMDLAVRAGIKGWKFVYLDDLKVKNELPSTFKAYRFQQHRWSCGPACLFRKILPDIINNKKVKFWKKFHILYGFFFVRKIVAHIVTFFFYCFVIPTTVLVPEVHLPRWGAVYMPSVITILNATCTMRSLHLIVFWILFENVMSLHRTKATFVGLFDLQRVNEWVVTEKLGNALKTKFSKLGKTTRMQFGDRLHVLEVLAGLYIFFCAVYDFYFGHNHFYIYLFLQAGAFFILGFGYMGTFVPN